MGGPVSDEELIENLREIADKAGHSPSIDEAQQYGKYSIQDYQERFGTWQTAHSLRTYSLRWSPTCSIPADKRTRTTR